MTLTLKQYRSEISSHWLKLVGRSKLTSHEYQLISGFYRQGLSLSVIIRAIEQVKERGKVVYSLGVIRADIEAIMKEKARMNVGGIPPIAKPDDKVEWDWRKQWREELASLAEEFPEKAEDFGSLYDALSDITLEGAQARLKQINQQE